MVYSQLTRKPKGVSMANSQVSTADKKQSQNQKTIDKRFKEGRGSGAGLTYKPYLTVGDISSKGRSHRLPSATVGRVHHLLSDLELHIFYQLDWHPNVKDIREQFPIPLSESRSLSEQMGIAHPSYNGCDQVVTTDFIVDIERNGLIKRKAISAKYAADLDDPRTLEKLELKRRYWESKDIPFRVVTEKEQNANFIKNIQWFHPHLTSMELSKTEQKEYFDIFCSTFSYHDTQKVTIITTRLDHDMLSESGTHLSILRHLLAQRAFTFDLINLSVINLHASQLTPSKHWLNERYEYVVG